MQPESQGFTLMELLIVIAMIAILVSLAAPSLENLMLRNRLSAMSSDIAEGIFLARSEAVKRYADVRLVPNDASNWGLGWQVVADGNRDGDFTDDPDDLPLFIGQSVHSSISVEKNGDYSLPNGFLNFNSLGAITPTDKFSLTIKATNCKYNKMYQLSVNASGHLVSTEANCST